MNLGFASVEAGFARAKNTVNILSKNFIVFAISSLGFILLGWGLMFGGTGGFVGTSHLWILGNVDLSFYDNTLTSAVPFWGKFFFELVFCGTAATIVSGAVAERVKYVSFIIFSFILTLLIYPMIGHWIWGGGWLAQMGFHDFAGSTAVHMVGGVAAFVGAAILGPRIGKYGKDGKARAIPGHSLTLGALGVFILWFCWFGFNGCSTVALTGGADETAARVFVTTNLAAAVATVTVMCITWIRYGKPDVSMTLNGSLAGLVAITAGCDVVTPAGAAAIGIIAGFVVVFGIEFIDQVVKVDDPVGAVGVHGLCGATGTLLTGVFAYYTGNEITKDGLIYGGGFHMLGVQIIGVVSVIAWVVVTMTIVFTILKKTIGLRVSAEEEIMGLDKPEHGLTSAYADFMPVVGVLGTAAGEAQAHVSAAPAEAVPVTRVSTEGGAATMHKVVILTRQSRFEALKNAMNDIGVTGMTLTNVAGCGVQKGAAEYYRGVPVDVMLLPKIKLEIVVSAIPVEKVIEAARKALYTGHIGDGKIFVYDVADVVKVRTGERGFDALQDED